MPDKNPGELPNHRRKKTLKLRTVIVIWNTSIRKNRGVFMYRNTTKEKIYHTYSVRNIHAKQKGGIELPQRTCEHVLCGSRAAVKRAA